MLGGTLAPKGKPEAPPSMVTHILPDYRQEPVGSLDSSRQGWFAAIRKKWLTVKNMEEE